ncbi:hypothetical protein JCM3765_006200 [Sporobolomyces pararoseus]
MVYSVSPNLPPKSLPARTNPTTVETSSHSSSTLVGSSDSPSNSSTSSSDSSEEDSDSDSDSDEDSATADSEDDEEETLKLEQLLIKAKQSAKQKQLAEKEKKNGVKGGEGDGLAGNEEMVLFGEEDDSEEDSDPDEENGTPKASTSKSSKSIILPPSLVQPLSLAPPTSISTNSASVKGKARAGPISLSQDLSGILTTSHSTRTTSNGQGEKWGMAPVPRLSKKQYKANQPHTAGSKWFDMPATPMTPELKREIDAMRLRNALDPKKFMKGSAKNEKIGEFFQVGHIITPNTRATTSNSLPTASKRSFVEELVEDEQARAYAKRKTKEVMQKGMSGRKRQRKGSKGSYAMGMGGGKDGAGSAGGKRRKR